MTDSALQLALREMRSQISDRRSWVLMLAVGLVLGLSGPFGTFEYLSLGARLAYWMAVVVGTYLAGSFASMLAIRLIPERHRRVPVLIPVSAMAATALVVPVLILINLAAFGPRGFDWFSFGSVLLYGFLISATVSSIGILFERAPESAVSGATVAPATVAPRLLDRLDAPKRGQLISLSVQDHYVEVTTSRGKSLLLMRLGDAIAETEGEPGVQIHRSHWVALSGVRSVHRNSGKVQVETGSGDILPVSRTYLPAAKKAGLIAD